MLAKEKNTLTIKNWAEDDKPREKLAKQGRQSLSNAELLAILLRSGTRSISAVELSRLILRKAADDNLDILSKLTVKELMKFKGIGHTKAVTIVAAMELARRRKDVTNEDKPTIYTSRSIFDLIYPALSDLDHEEFYIILVNRANKVIKTERVAIGGVTATVADIRIMFKSALENLATGIILAHNHPSGQLKPSDEDIELTNRVKEAGKLLTVHLIDHIIIGNNSYFSFTAEGIL